MNLILGISIPLANEQDSVFKVPIRLLQKIRLDLQVIKVLQNPLVNLHLIFKKTRFLIAIRSLVFLRSWPLFMADQLQGFDLLTKGTAKPSEIFSLLGIRAQNPSDSTLELLGLNPSLF